MRLRQFHFRGVFYGHNPFGFRDIVGKHIEQGGFTAAGTAGNDDIFPVNHCHLQEFHHVFVDGAKFNHVLIG